MAEVPRRRQADELSRRRAGRYRAPETGRVHHLGQAPALQPVVTSDGVEMSEAAAVRLARLMDAQVVALGEDLRARMASAAQAMDFEGAARLRDEAAAVDAELARRTHAP